MIKEKILIYGMGVTGKAVKNFCSLKKIPYELYDDTKNEVDFKEILKDISTVVLSPGIKKTNLNIQIALKKKIEVISEIEFAAKFTKKPIIAITGTNGKTTTTLLTYEILKNYGLKVFIGGNIGTPFIKGILMQENYDIFLLECSSFQLQFIDKEFSPRVSVITNLSPNHLDHHKDLDEYYESKFNIFKNQKKNDFLILKKNIELNSLKTIPRKIFLRIPRKKNYIEVHGLKILLKNLKIVGSHNIENLLFALEIANIFVNLDKNILEKIYQFQPPSFRLEKILGNPKIFNDSKSTSPDATINAIESFNSKIYLLMGGKDKNLDYTTVKKILAKKVRKVFLFGENKFLLAQFFSSKNCIICKDMEDTIIQLKKIVKKTDTIVFSPGSSSFDTYTSYIERGEKFNQYVNKFFK